MKKIIAPSILSADFSRLGEQVKTVTDAGAEYVHIDVMDGHFVPNITIGSCVVKSLRNVSSALFDVHLMIEKPERYVEDFALSGADLINFHYEATEDVKKTIQLIRNTGKKVGITIKPETNVEEIFPYVPLVDMVLVMTVNPGFGGQTLIEGCLDKVRTLRSKFVDLDIEVDGGIKISNIKKVTDAGANIIVAGSAVFGAQSPEKIIEEMMR